MARYEITVRTDTTPVIPSPELLETRALRRRRPRDARLRRACTSGLGELTVVLQPRTRRNQPDGAWTMARLSLFELGIHPNAIQQVDVHRLSRRGSRRTLVRSWGPGGDGPGTAGVREPRAPLPRPPYLRAALNLPDSGH